jgi:hypothetical protein
MELPADLSGGIWYAADRGEVEEGHIEGMEHLLAYAMQPQNTRALRTNIDFTIDGYDNDPRDLSVIPEASAWLAKVARLSPYWFYFLRPGTSSSLPLIGFGYKVFRLVTPSLRTAEPEAMQAFMQYHLDAMKSLCAKLSEPDEVVNELTHGVFRTLLQSDAPSELLV